MKRFTHVPGTLYRVMDGVRRAKAAQLAGHTQIRPEAFDPAGRSLAKGWLPLAALRSPKALIRRITPADETRWQRVVAGAQPGVLPYPPLTVQPGGEQGSRMEDVGFDFGG